MTKTILNIFGREKQIIKKEVPKQRIIADYREKNCMVTSILKKFDIDTEFRELKVADYIVKDVAIERKTVSDFISSMINKRLVKQIEELQQYEKRLLIIEGTSEQELYDDEKDLGVSANAIRGFLLSISLKSKTPIIFTKNAEDTARFISVILKKQAREVSLNAKKKIFTKKEQLQYIVESFPGIGPKSAKKILKEFKTIKNFINAPEDELQKLLGKKSETIKKLIEENY